MLIITPRVSISESEFTFTFARSSGPGGQNVNKVNSKVLLRWNIAETAAFGEDLRQRVSLKLANQITGDGDLLITSDRFRDQKQNRQDCLDKLAALVRAALVVPKARTKTKPTKGSVRRKHKAKELHSQKKTHRGKVDY